MHITMLGLHYYFFLPPLHLYHVKTKKWKAGFVFLRHKSSEQCFRSPRIVLVMQSHRSYTKRLQTRWHYQTKYLYSIACSSRRNVSRENKLLCNYWPFCKNTCSKSGRHEEKNQIVNFLKRRHVANTTQSFKMPMLSLKWLKKVSFRE